MGEIVSSSLTSSSSTYNSDKDVIARKLFGSNEKNIKKYKIGKEIRSIVGWRRRKILTKESQEKGELRKTKMLELKKKVVEFFVDDDNSYSTPGRRDTITRNKTKKQKRYLSDTLINLHKKFMTTDNLKISYSLFCRLKPFWIIYRPANLRDTCLCKYHENFNFVFKKCKQLKILNDKNPKELIESVCCNIKNKMCMYRECKECQEKKLSFNCVNDIDEESVAFYYEWKRLKEERVKKGKFEVTVTKKVKIYCTFSQLKDKMNTMYPIFMQHMYRAIHQSTFSKILRSKLEDDEVFMVVDFSESYQLKYANEIQSCHFGASNEQLTLHTGAYFINKTEEDQKNIEVKSFCTVSQSKRTDAAAIWAHIIPILKIIKEKCPSVKVLHILSDGPTKQYRNKINLYLFSHFVKEFGYERATYNFSESGHGKSIADGIGGVVKRTADKSVSLGTDVASMGQFINAVSSLKVKMVLIQQSDIESVEKILPSNKIPAIPQTMKLHQVAWNASAETSLDLRYLSCTECQDSCSHFKLQENKFSFGILPHDAAMVKTCILLCYSFLYYCNQTKIIIATSYCFTSSLVTASYYLNQPQVHLKI